MASKTEDLSAAHKRLLGYAHPLREKIFTILTERKASAAELTRDLGLPRKDLSNVTHHLRKLVEYDCAVLVEEVQDGGRPPEKFYKATAAALIATDEWEDLVAQDPAFAEYQLSRAMQVQLDDFVAAQKAGTIGQTDDFHMSRTRHVYDQQGLMEGMEILERARRDLGEVARRSAERISDEGAEGFDVSQGLALFRVP